MEFYQLRYFAKAAAYENISMAAQDLHVTQPSISKAVKALEKELQVELMRRNGKYCELQNRQSRQQIRLNVLSASFLIPDLIRKFRASHGDVFFRILDRRESISWDICIRSTLPEVFFSNAVKLMDEELLLACRRDSRLAEKKRITLSDLSNED